MSLQQQNHAIILMIDAKQTMADCYKDSSVKPYSIEWLCIQRGMTDPFINNFGSCPNSTTQTPIETLI
jgi:hypothetical protein